MASKQDRDADSVKANVDGVGAEVADEQAAPQAPSLKWRPHLQRIVMTPNIPGRAEGKVSWRAASGETDDGEWIVLPVGEDRKLPARSAATVLERFHEDGLRWTGRQMDFHGGGRLVGPIVMRDAKYRASAGLRRRLVKEVIALALIGTATVMLLRADILPSRDHLAFVFIAAAGLSCMALFDMLLVVKEMLWRRKSKTEKIGLPSDLNEVAGATRPRVLTRVIEDGIEQEDG